MIYICIPTHNEQQTVGVILWKLRQVLTDFPRDYQLLVADDASTDKTPDVLEPYTRVLPLTVIRSDTRQGPAASLEMLMREAVRRSEYPKRDAIVTLQADFSEEPDDLVPLIKRLEAGADVAVGNKVSSAREPRARRLSRSLARFFLRRQKWPEGVISPFDGYRAYRLYAVKRAMEDRAGKRLVRFDGWAGNAELLRAVLPHARRVDAVTVEDRPDRLQRPRREMPFAAALLVRTMASGTEPEGLIGVEELDRIATTASRSRERAAAAAPSVHGGRGGRTNGSHDRRPGPGARDRTQGRANGAGRSRGERGATRSRTQDATEDVAPRREGRTRQRKTEAGAPSPGRSRTGSEAGKHRQPRTEAAPVSAEESVQPLVAALEGDVAPESASRPKRKRRRRRKSGQGGAKVEQGSPAEETVAEAEAAESPDEAADTADTDGPVVTGEKKRRRRGGRRGGRGRRRAGPEGAAENGSDGTVDASAVQPVSQAPEPAGTAESD